MCRHVKDYVAYPALPLTLAQRVGRGENLGMCFLTHAEEERVRDGNGTVWNQGQYCVGRWDVHEGYVAYPALFALAQRVGREKRAHDAAWVNGFVLDACRGGNGYGTGTGPCGDRDGKVVASRNDVQMVILG